MDFKIRRIDLKDIDVIVPLFDAYRVFYKQGSDLSKAYEFIYNRLSLHESIIFMAFDHKNNGIGFTQLYPTFSSVSMQRSFILNDLYVSIKARGKGVGQQLLEFSQEFVTKHQYKGLALETGIHNPAQKLYERLNWNRDAETYNYFWESSTE